MYSINDRTAAIKEVQGYLIKIGYGDNVIPNGKFDTYTELAIKSFQKGMEIEESGVVNYQTYTILEKEYKKSILKDKVNRYSGLSAYFPIKFGDIGEHILPINFAIAYVSDHFGIPHSVRKGNFFSNGSANATAELQRAMLLTPDGIIDQLFYDRVMRIYKNILCE